MMKDKLRILKSKIKSHIQNTKGWKTDRKLLIIESDDWGSIRMPSSQVYKAFVAKGFSLEKSLYNRYDSLASEEDLTALFEVLISIKDIHGNPLKITANTVVANPDFDKIEAADYKKFYYEYFTETLQKYPKHANSFPLWKEGIHNKVFIPQFHAREHLNINLWMKELQSENRTVHYTFGHRTTYSGKEDYSFMDAFDYELKDELKSLKEIAEDGLRLFETIFGYKSKSFIAPCYIWHPDLEPVVKKMGVDYFQGTKEQLIPTENHFQYDRIKHYMGEHNVHGQIYLTRNATFEPSSVEGMDWVNYCLQQIETAFFWKKPAIITSHRINYIGFLDPSNRTKNLKLLRQLILKVQQRWPDVEFISSDQLGDLISESYDV